MKQFTPTLFTFVVAVSLSLSACSSEETGGGVASARQDQLLKDREAGDAMNIGRDQRPSAVSDARLDRGARDAFIADFGVEDGGGGDQGADEGAMLYERFCAFCHGSEGEGYLADNANALANTQFLETASDEFLRVAIVQGRPGTPMSPWGEAQGGPLSDEEVEAIISYMRRWPHGAQRDLDLDQRVVEGAPLRGESAYRAACAGCHGESGEGVSAISLNNPWFLESAGDAFIRAAIVEGRPRTSMGGYAELLPAGTIDDITALIRSWARPVDAEPIPPFAPQFEEVQAIAPGEAPSFTLREGRFLPAAQLHEAMEAGLRLALIDARPSADYLESHIAGAYSIPFYEIGALTEALPRDLFYVTYCGCPHAVSGQAADALLEAGFPRVAVLDEGFYFWEAQGWPLRSGRTP
ncbi:MAG: c-type cytochrome [Myxococcota bacterium]|nr:c-type cytochrome [Myxococcota bacterium]